MFRLKAVGEPVSGARRLEAGRREDENEVSYGGDGEGCLEPGSDGGWYQEDLGLYSLRIISQALRKQGSSHTPLLTESSWCDLAHGMCGLYFEPGFFNLRWYFWPDNFFVVLFGGGELGGCPVPCRMFSGIPPAPPLPCRGYDNQKCLQTLPRVPRCQGSRASDP